MVPGCARSMPINTHPGIDVPLLRPLALLTPAPRDRAIEDPQSAMGRTHRIRESFCSIFQRNITQPFLVESPEFGVSAREGTMRKLLISVAAVAAAVTFAPVASYAQGIGIDTPVGGVRIGEPYRHHYYDEGPVVQRRVYRE